MKNNLRAATWIIASLSLLLGFSIGQIQRQYWKIQDLQSELEPDFEDEVYDFEFDYDVDIDVDVEPAIEEHWHQSGENGIIRFEMRNKCDELRAKRDELHALREHWQAAREAQLHQLELEREQERAARQRVIIIR
ncbi:MAG: hypothetical protein SFU99_21975 [Saprospiraceae bacterium]|nr:hypothetical protein [Saprospiraceae bacterium]